MPGSGLKVYGGGWVGGGGLISKAKKPYTNPSQIEIGLDWAVTI